MRDLPKQQTAPPSMSPLDPYAHAAPTSSVELESGSTSGPSTPQCVTEHRESDGSLLVNIEESEVEFPEEDFSPASLDDVIVAVDSIQPCMLGIFDHPRHVHGVGVV